MAKSKELELAIKIAGEVERSFYNSTKLTKKELAAIAKSAANASDGIGYSFTSGLDKASTGISSMSKVAAKALKFIEKSALVAATAIAAITAATVTAGIEYESAFAGVKKTTDATKAEYAELRQGIIDMTNEIPASASAIAGVAEVAGQLGVEKDNLLDFSRVMIDIGESTNLTATDAATALAKFANITKMGADEYDNLGSVIVALGNNFATTEADIVEMGTRLASSGEIAGLTEPQIMALATAMSSVGIEAEAGGSAMSKLIKQMQVSVETGKGSLKDFASVAGVTTKQFQVKFKEDAVGALSLFIDGLNDVERNGKSATVILDDMGLTEVRLSNMILSLANASGTMTDAITLSNEAWVENTALSEEAGKRYETTESKLSILKNGLTGLGIRIYDELSEPLREGIDAGTEFVSNLTGEVGKGLNIFSKQLPTVIRRTKETAGAFRDFMDPVFDLGSWMIKHPNVIGSTLVGIGSAIATYKVAQGLNSVVKGFTVLAGILTNPFAAAIFAVGLAIGGAAGISTYINNLNKEMKKQNLAEHFGSISLSLKDLKEVAAYIVQTDDLGKIREALNAMDDMDAISISISDAVESLNKMNWKISIGMELSEAEKQEYQDNIVSYIADVQELVTQKQYAITLAVGVLMGNDGLEKSNVITQINEFYSDKQKELADLGTNLNDVVTKAFQDGLLDVDEVKEITELQSQMAKIQSAVAGSQFDAQLELLNLKYSGGELDAESFQNLQAEINKQVQEAVADYDESLTLGISNAKVMFDDGALDKAGYDAMVQDLKKGYLEQIGEIELKATNFQLDTIKTQYSDELGAAMPEFKTLLEGEIGRAIETIPTAEYPKIQWDGILSNIMSFDGLDEASKLALGDLFTKIKPSMDNLEALESKYKEAGLKVPQAISDGISDIKMLGAITENENAIWSSIGELSDNTEYASALEEMYNAGTYIPEELANAIENNKKAVESPIAGLYLYSQDYMKKTFGKGFSFNTSLKVNTEIPTFFNPLNSLGGHAEGGIFDIPHVAWFAEDGPEAAIPLDGSNNAIGLWKTVGKLLGVYSGSSNEQSFSSLAEGNIEKPESFKSLLDRLGSQGNGNNGRSKLPAGQGIVYSPVINFYGGTPSKEDMVEAGRISQEEFDSKMEYWMSQNDRLDFA